MKIFWIGSAYAGAYENALKKLPKEWLIECSYAQLKQYLDDQYVDYFSKGMVDALKLLGYDIESVLFDLPILQKKWVHENLRQSTELKKEDILFKQIKNFKPDIIFVNDCMDVPFLQYIREKISSVKYFIASSGSALAMLPHKQPLWQFVDAVLCCAMESVGFLRSQGVNAIHFNHGFFSRMPSKNVVEHMSCTFIGSIIRESAFHLKREKLLIEMSSKLPMAIYSPSADISFGTIAKGYFKQIVYDGLQVTPACLRSPVINAVPKLKKFWKAGCRPMNPINFRLMKYLKPAIYGKDMFSVLAASDIVLNIHADSSPMYASNMRLYETTGMQSCLLTDNRRNMKELFNTDTEVVVYDSAEDCVEKAKWLLNHPKERGKIALAGYKRCMKDHTYEVRARQFDEILKRLIKS